MSRYSGGLSARRTLQRSPNLCLLQLGVSQRRANIAMAEHTLDDLYSLALRDKFAATGMAELVRRVPRRAGRVEQACGAAELGPLVVQCVV